MDFKFLDPLLPTYLYSYTVYDKNYSDLDWLKTVPPEPFNISFINPLHYNSAMCYYSLNDKKSPLSVTCDRWSIKDGGEIPLRLQVGGSKAREKESRWQRV